MDFITSFLMTFIHQNYVMVMVDRLTKLAHFIPVVYVFS